MRRYCRVLCFLGFKGEEKVIVRLFFSVEYVRRVWGFGVVYIVFVLVGEVVGRGLEKEGDFWC